MPTIVAQKYPYSPNLKTDKNRMFKIMVTKLDSILAIDISFTFSNPLATADSHEFKTNVKYIRINIILYSFSRGTIFVKIFIVNVAKKTINDIVIYLKLIVIISFLSYLSSNKKRITPSLIHNVNIGYNKDIVVLYKSYVPYSEVVRIPV